MQLLGAFQGTFTTEGQVACWGLDTSRNCAAASLSALCGLLANSKFLGSMEVSIPLNKWEVFAGSVT